MFLALRKFRVPRLIFGGGALRGKKVKDSLYQYMPENNRFFANIFYVIKIAQN